MRNIDHTLLSDSSADDYRFDQGAPAVKHPATQVVHWATGPVNCCDEHAAQLIGLDNFLGTHTVATTLLEPAESGNCVNENRGKS